MSVSAPACEFHIHAGLYSWGMKICFIHKMNFYIWRNVQQPTFRPDCRAALSSDLDNKR